MVAGVQFHFGRWAILHRDGLHATVSMTVGEVRFAFAGGVAGLGDDAALYPSTSLHHGAAMRAVGSGRNGLARVRRRPSTAVVKLLSESNLRRFLEGE
jgi:hypothetical protein